MIAYQIVIKGDLVSERYAAISRRSFQPAIDAGIISEIRTFDAITPQSQNFQEHINRYNWAPSDMNADIDSGKNKDDHSETEKAGMCSHWELMRIQSQSNERFFVMEHDTYLIPEYLNVLKDLIKFLKEEKPIYFNIGLFMGMYSLEQRCSKYQYDLLRHRNFPINCGPYCTLQRLFRTYTTRHLEKPEINYYGKKVTVVHPWTQCVTLGFGRECGLYFNKPDLNIQNSIPNPTTQVISKRLLVSQDHHGYADKYIEKPWTRHNYFHVIE